MVVLEHAHWIGGLERPGRAGLGFEQHSLVAPFGVLGRWPRAGPEEVRAALEQAREVLPAWRRTPWSRRMELLARVPPLLEARADLDAQLAPSLGLEREELAARLAEDLFRFREGLELFSDRGPGEGAGLFQAHWSDLVGGLASRLAARLAAGEAALLLSSPRLPQAAEALVLALAEAGLPAGLVALLHDDTRATLEAALGDARLGWVRLKGSEEALRGVESRWRPREGDGFGAGLVQWSAWPLANRTHAVLAADDPAAAAALVLEHGLSRAGSLSGQLPGQVARVVCHGRRLSELTAELLRLLASSADVARPVPLIEPELFDHARAAWALGLDEGATPIFGDEPSRAAPRGKAPLALEPVLFTNVEPGHALARLRRPAPVLALLRARSDAEAAELRARLDA